VDRRSKEYKAFKKMIGQVVELPENEREQYFREFNPLMQEYGVERKCIHCGERINTKDYKLVIGEDAFADPFVFISCPNYPDCDGTPLDWI
jgi:hypothetical protein